MIKIRDLLKIIKPTLQLQDEFDVALENIIFESKIISIEKGYLIIMG